MKKITARQIVKIIAETEKIAIATAAGIATGRKLTEKGCNEVTSLAAGTAVSMGTLKVIDSTNKFIYDKLDYYCQKIVNKDDDECCDACEKCENPCFDTKACFMKDDEKSSDDTDWKDSDDFEKDSLSEEEAYDDMDVENSVEESTAETETEYTSEFVDADDEPVEEAETHEEITEESVEKEKAAEVDRKIAAAAKENESYEYGEE